MLMTFKEVKLHLQVKNIEGALQWLKTCPFEYNISSMQGGFIHIKLFVPMDKEVIIKEKGASR